ncbi:MAG: hypothetical protein RRA35_13880 [Desulfomonilia bacterium]|nr:hypothetical protein [Desulfomonilia bacterium]
MDEINQTHRGMTRRTFVKGVGGLAVLGVLGLWGCAHRKKKPKPQVIPTTDQIITIKYRDRNLNGRFDPWIDERIGEDWFFYEGESMVIYIVPENSRQGDDLLYVITGPNGKEVLRNRTTLSSDDGYAKIHGFRTSMTEYFTTHGGYGTFRVDAWLNGRVLMAEGKEFKIAERPR